MEEEKQEGREEKFTIRIKRRKRQISEAVMLEGQVVKLILLTRMLFVVFLSSSFFFFFYCFSINLFVNSSFRQTEKSDITKFKTY